MISKYIHVLLNIMNIPRGYQSYSIYPFLLEEVIAQVFFFFFFFFKDDHMWVHPRSVPDNFKGIILLDAHCKT